jgi:outer membrane immunogenic protein
MAASTNGTTPKPVPHWAEYTMKKLLASMAITAGFAGSAIAADLPMKAAPMAPAQVMAASWTGCYVGAGGGYGMFVQRHHTVNAAGAPVTAGETDTGGKGWFGTVQVGCDYQFADRWVIGAFGDWDWSGLRGNLQPTGIVTAGGGGLGVWGEERQKDTWAAGARLGYVVLPRLLGYVAGGYTETRFEGVSFSNLVNNTATGISMDAQKYKGWFLATGYEYGLDFIPGLFWKTEYRYANYRAENPALTGPGTALVAVLPTGIGFENSKKDVQTIRSELVYRFNFGGGRF